MECGRDAAHITDHGAPKQRTICADGAVKPERQFQRGSQPRGVDPMQDKVVARQLPPDAAPLVTHGHEPAIATVDDPHLREVWPVARHASHQPIGRHQKALGDRDCIAALRTPGRERRTERREDLKTSKKAWQVFHGATFLAT